MPPAGPEPDPELRDYENVPLAHAIETFFDREIKPSARLLD